MEPNDQQLNRRPTQLPNRPRQTVFDRLSLHALSNSKRQSRNVTARDITPLRLDSATKKDPNTDRSENRSFADFAEKLSVVTLCTAQKEQQRPLHKQIQMLCDILNDIWLMLLNKRFILASNFQSQKQQACNTIYELQESHRQYWSLKEQVAQAIGIQSLQDCDLVDRCQKIVSCLITLQEENQQPQTEQDEQIIEVDEPELRQYQERECQTDSLPNPHEYKNLMSKIAILESQKSQLVATIEHQVNSLKTTINELFKENGALMQKLAAAQSYIKECAISTQWNIKVLESALERERRVSASINQNTDDPEVQLKILELDARCRQYEQHITNLERIILDERQTNRYLSDEIQHMIKTDRVKSPEQFSKSPINTSNFYFSPQIHMRQSTEMLCQSTQKLFLRNQKIEAFNNDIENIFQQFTLDATINNALLSFTKGLVNYPEHDILYLMVQKMLENICRTDDRQQTMRVYLDQMEAVLDECQQGNNQTFVQIAPKIVKVLPIIQEEESVRECADSGVHMETQTENFDQFENIQAFRSEIKEMFDEANAFRRSLQQCLSRPDRTKNLSSCNILGSLENRL